MEDKHPLQAYSLSQRLCSAAFYGATSLAVIFVNKLVLTSYQFPSFLFLALAQFVATCAVFYFLAWRRMILLTPLSKAVIQDVGPVSMLFLLNVITGLSGTQSINLPMFTVLRRFSILMTMLLEGWILGKKPSNLVSFSVFLMLFGAGIAAVYDLAFDSYGYTMIMLNNLFTALNGVYLKKASMSNKLTKLSVLYYNSMFSAIALVVLFVFLPREQLVEIITYEQWLHLDFVVLFVLAAVLGCILNYSIFLCTATNSALTTTVVGCLKNILTTYLGILVGGDYHFTILNFAGLNISIIGSLIYSWVTFKQ